MPRTAAAPASTSAQPPTVASILTLIAAVERRDPADPAAAAFRLALARKGREADAAGGPATTALLIREIAEADPDLAERRVAILREAWADTGGNAR